MKMSWYLFLSGSLSMSIALLGCASSNKIQSGRSDKPSWVIDRPVSQEYFIGIGSSTVTSGNLGDAQEKSRMAALQDIAQQIEVDISSDKRLFESHEEVNKTYQDVSVYEKQIHTLAQAVLAGWEVKQTWNDPSGYYWTQIVLEKNAYYAQKNKKINDVIAFVVDAINAAGSGPVSSRLRQLFGGLAALDSFPSGALRGVIDGKEVILKAEIPRRIENTLASIELRPNVNNLKLRASAVVPETLGVYAFFEGHPDPSSNVIWTSSSNAVSLQGMPARQDGLQCVIIKPLPASAGIVTIAASPDIGNIRYDLIQRGFKLPSGSFAITRNKPVVSMASGEFTGEVYDRLLSRGAILQPQAGEKADYSIECVFSPDNETTESMGMFKVRGTLTVKMTDSSSSALLNYKDTFGAAAIQSSKQAVTNLQKIAVDEAVKKIEGAF